MRKVMVLLFLLAGPCAAPEIPELTRKIARFELAWDKFVRRYFGCPEDRTLVEPTAECKLALGLLDYTQFNKARAAAKDLFEFKE